MKKSTIINSCLNIAHSFNTNPDFNSLSKWSYALARFILYHTPQHDSAVEIEHLIQRLYSEQDHQSVINEYIQEVEKATNDINGNENIIYEPPFTFEWSALHSQP